MIFLFADAGLSVCLLTDAELSVRLLADKDLSGCSHIIVFTGVRLFADTDLSVRFFADAELSVRLFADADLTVRVFVDMDLSVRLLADADLSECSHMFVSSVCFDDRVLRCVSAKYREGETYLLAVYWSKSTVSW